MPTEGQTTSKWYHTAFAAILIALVASGTAPWWFAEFRERQGEATTNAAGPSPSSHASASPATQAQALVASKAESALATESPKDEVQPPEPPTPAAPSVDPTETLAFATKFLGVCTIGEHVDSLAKQGISATLNVNARGQQYVSYKVWIANKEWSVSQALDASQMLRSASLQRDAWGNVWRTTTSGDSNLVETLCAEPNFAHYVGKFVEEMGQPRHVTARKGLRSTAREDDYKVDTVDFVAAVEWPLENGGLLALSMHQSSKLFTEARNDEFHHEKKYCAINACLFPDHAREGCAIAPGIAVYFTVSYSAVCVPSARSLQAWRGTRLATYGVG